MERYVCIHGHFYQPPRENPWLEEVEVQDSAHPYHDWNERITAECYAPNAASRIMDGKARITDIVNNYWKINFNFGPTLLSWMERHAPDTYRAVIDADLRSRDAFSGHGSAIAQVFNHMIMPLANEAHKRIQVKWGISDFIKRFNREPEGIWLPETAVDLKTLEVCADAGIRFTILAPHQAGKVRSMDGGDWKNVAGGAIDTKKPYTCRLPTGKSISIFFYDKRLSHDVAFAGLLRDGKAFSSRLIEAFVNEETPQLVNVATDGETYGHHHRFGDMALAYCLHHIYSNGLAKITNYGEFLEKFPPKDEVQIVENTSWSCAHGIERWRSNCGCNSGGHAGWNQTWREPLRIAMDWLRDQLSQLFEQEASKYLNNPWKALEEYISVILDRSPQNTDNFLSSQCREGLTGDQKILALKLLEMQRHSMLMYTSCGWFFDDVSGIETVQVMQYAARALQLAYELTGTDIESEYVKLLSVASSNQPEIGNAAAVFQRYAKPTSVDLIKVGAHYAMLSIFDHMEAGTSKVYCYNIVDEVHEVLEAGKQKLVIGRSRISSEITREQETVSFAALWLGDHNVFGGARRYMGPEHFEGMRNEMSAAFRTGEVHNLVIPIVNYYGSRSHSLTQLFRDDQRRIMEMILRSSLDRAHARYDDVFESNYPILRFLNELNISTPRALLAAAEVAISSQLYDALSSDSMELDKLERLVEDVNRFSVRLDKELLAVKAASVLAACLQEMLEHPADREGLLRIAKLLKILAPLQLEPNLWRSQNLMFSLAKRNVTVMRERAALGDDAASKWIAAFEGVSEMLGIKIQT